MTQGPPVEGELKATLGPFDATMIVMGCIVGAGIFRTPRDIAAHMGSVTGVLTVWILGGLVACCGALVFAELGARLPRVGGQYAFLRHGLGRFMAFLFGWSYLATVVSGAVAYVALVFVDHGEALVRMAAPDTTFGRPLRLAIATTLIVGLALLNVRGVKLGARVQNVAMVAKVLGILTVVFLWLVFLLTGGSAGTAAPTTAAAADGGTHWGMLGIALLPAAFSYGGFQNLAAAAPEVKQPRRTLPLAILLGTGLVVTLYVAVNAAVVGILGVSGAAASETPVASAAGQVWRHGETFVAVLVMVSTFGIVQALLLVMPRIYYAMAKDGAFLPAVGRIHPTFGTPAVAILLQAGFTLMHLFLGQHLDLLEMAVMVDWIFLGGCAVVYFLLRRRDAAEPGCFRAPGHPILPAVFLLFALTIVCVSPFQASITAVQRAAGLFVLGVVLYLWLGRRNQSPA